MTWDILGQDSNISSNDSAQCTLQLRSSSLQIDLDEFNPRDLFLTPKYPSNPLQLEKIYRKKGEKFAEAW